MLVRGEQIEELDRQALRQYEHQLVEHLRKFAPAHAESLEDGVLLQLVQVGRRQAAKYGFRNRGPIRFYVELMIRFGTYFDSDPQYPWIAKLLREGAGEDENTRAAVLYEHARNYIDEVVGEDETREREALAAAAFWRFEDFETLSGDFESEALRHLERLYPAKYRFIGEAPLRNLIDFAAGQGVSLGLSPVAGRALLTGLMFAFGHGCLRDPQFSWIQKVLLDPAIAPNEKEHRLFEKTLSYCRSSVAYLQKRG